MCYNSFSKNKSYDLNCIHSFPLISLIRWANVGVRVKLEETTHSGQTLKLYLQSKLDFLSPPGEERKRNQLDLGIFYDTCFTMAA